MLDTCAKYNISVLMDVHTARGSQNGFDNSGMAHRLEWEANGTVYHHWDIQTASWGGVWNAKDQKYDTLDYNNIQRSLKVVEDLLKRFGSHSAFAAFEPVNEPLFTDQLGGLLEIFYRETIKLVKRYAPQATTVLHDAYDFNPDRWNALLPES
jgi:glucan 1,3-beta-glucosidase